MFDPGAKAAHGAVCLKFRNPQVEAVAPCAVGGREPNIGCMAHRHVREDATTVSRRAEEPKEIDDHDRIDIRTTDPQSGSADSPQFTHRQRRRAGGSMRST